MPRADRRRSEIVDTINEALEIVDDVAQEGDGDLVRAVVASFALKQLSEGNYEDDRGSQDEDEAQEEDEEQGGESASESHGGSSGTGISGAWRTGPPCQGRAPSRRLMGRAGGAAPDAPHGHDRWTSRCGSG